MRLLLLKTQAGQKAHVVGFYDKQTGVEYNPDQS